MRKNGDISFPRWSVGLKRLPQKEKKRGSLQAWQQCRTPAQGLKVLVQAQLQKGVLHGNHGVPRAMHWTCSHISSTVSIGDKYDAHISLSKNPEEMWMRQLMPWAPCSQSGDGWKNWNPTSWSHSTFAQFSVFPAYILACWQLLQQTIASAGSGTEQQPSERACVVWGCVGHREQTPAGWVEQHLLCFAVLPRVKVPATALLHSCLWLGNLEAFGARPWCSKAGHSALAGLSNICSTDHVEAGKTGPPSRIHRTMCQAGIPPKPAGNMWDSSWGWILPIIKIWGRYESCTQDLLPLSPSSPWSYVSKSLFQT